jgi:hypothetical protein
VQVKREQEMAALEANEDLDEMGNIADKQAGHSPHVAAMVYGQESTELAGSTTTRRLQFHALSMDWHRFLGFPDLLLDSTVLGKHANPWEEQAINHEEQQQQQLAAMNMEQALQ